MPKGLFQYRGQWIAYRPDGRSPYLYRTWYDRRDGPNRQERRASLRTADLEEAKDRLIAWVQENTSAPLGDRRAVTLTGCVMSYLRRVADKKPSAERARIAARQILEYWEPATVADLTPQRQHAFIEHLRTHREVGGRRKPGETPKLSSKPRTTETISNVLSVLRAALNQAVKWQELTSAPFIFDVKRPDKAKDPLSLGDVARILDCADCDYLRTFVWLTLGTAGRKRAVLDLTWFQVDLARHRIHLNPRGRDQTAKRRGIAPIGPTLHRILEGLPRDGEHLVQSRGRALDDVKAAWRRARRAPCQCHAEPVTAHHRLRAAGAWRGPAEVAPSLSAGLSCGFGVVSGGGAGFSMALLDGPACGIGGGEDGFQR